MPHMTAVVMKVQKQEKDNFDPDFKLDTAILWVPCSAPTKSEVVGMKCCREM